MLSSSSAKTRLQATLSLARLHDQRAMKPLVTALQFPIPKIRAVAATALGKILNNAALPALKAAALDDLDESVKKAARDAYAAIAKANHMASDLPAVASTEPAIPAAAAESAATPPPATVQARKTGFGRSPQRLRTHVLPDGASSHLQLRDLKDRRGAVPQTLWTTIGGLPTREHLRPAQSHGPNSHVLQAGQGRRDLHGGRGRHA